MEKIKQFFEDSKQELKKVNWPTKEETIKYTVFVIGISIITALFLGALDFIFVRVLQLTI